MHMWDYIMTEGWAAVFRYFNTTHVVCHDQSFSFGLACCAVMEPFFIMMDLEEVNIAQYFIMFYIANNENLK